MIAKRRVLVLKIQVSSINRLYIFFFALAYGLFFVPEPYAISEQLYRCCQIVQLGVCLFVIYIYLLTCRIKIQWICFCAFFVLVYVLSSLVAHSDARIISIIYSTGAGIGFVSLTCLGLQKCRYECILGFCIGGVVQCLFNFLTFLTYKDIVGGMMATIRVTDQNYFLLGYDNITLFYYLPVMFVLALFAIYFHSKKAVVVCIVFSLITLLMYLSLSAITAVVVVGLSLFAIMLVLQKRYAFAMRLSYYQVLFFTIVIAVLVIFVVTSGIASSLIPNQEKSASIGERTKIWSAALDLFMSNPVLGMGLNASGTSVSYLSYDHVHNVFLQILYQGGFFSLISFLFCLALGVFKSPVQRINILSNKQRRLEFLFAGYLGLWMLAAMLDFEIRLFPQYFPIILYSYYVVSRKLSGKFSSIEKVCKESG